VVASLEESSKRRQEIDSRRLGARGKMVRRRRWEARVSDWPRGWARSSFEGSSACCMFLHMPKGASS